MFFSFVINFADKKPKPENVDIYTLKLSDKRCKVVKWSLIDVWKQGFIIRINNFGDKEKIAHCEKDIKNQVSGFQATFCVYNMNSSKLCALM